MFVVITLRRDDPMCKTDIQFSKKIPSPLRKRRRAEWATMKGRHFFSFSFFSIFPLISTI